MVFTCYIFFTSVIIRIIATDLLKNVTQFELDRSSGFQKNIFRVLESVLVMIIELAFNSIICVQLLTPDAKNAKKRFL